MKYYLIAGEASGDLHGSNVMKGLKGADLNADFRFLGGDMMQSVGGTLVKHYKEGAVMGIVEIIGKLRKIFKNLSMCKKDILTYKPDVIILIDYPGFNIKIAKFAKKHGIKVFYYIAPKVWAWREYRVKSLKKYVDQLFIIFPFEVDYFKKVGIDAVYEGNPLVDTIINSPAMSESEAEFRERVSIDTEKPIIALLAGSRVSEIEYLLPRYVEIAKIFEDKFQFLLATAPSIDRERYDKHLKHSSIVPIAKETYSILRWAKAAIIASGTASLEAALIGTPQVVGYGGSPISYSIAKRFVKVKYISLGNLIIDRLAFKELIQQECTPDNLASELSRLLYDTAYISAMTESYNEIRENLGTPGASVRIGEAMYKILSSGS